MSIHASVHIDTGSTYSGFPSVGDHGYVRIETEDSPYANALAIHGDAASHRRLAAALLALADELDPPADDFANSLALASYGAMADREDETPRMGENR